ncbi:MAG: hypothetical protein KDB36_01320 [Acidimicrobiales bacterium]|nr:hypothetical protein [Acidimicrobiales bacterium]
MRRGGRRAALLAVAALGLAAGACTPSADAGSEGQAAATGGAAASGPTSQPPEHLEAEVLSSRAEDVTGGDTVVQVRLPAGLAADAVTVTADATGEAFPVEVDRTGRHVARVSGLPDGSSTITAVAGDGDRATVEVTNHPTTGPLFSGPHLPMPVCSTDLYGLGEPLDEDCSATTSIRWKYLSTDGELKPLDDPSTLPTDVETIGETKMPFIVRQETGTLNRGIYWITVLDPMPDPTSQQWDPSAWNGRLIYEFGGGCGTSYSQGFKMLGDPSTELLERGYAFATSTLNTFQVACNDVLSAESVSMVKERFAEGYDTPAFTIGSGGSGGAIQQYLIAQNYPGLLDAISPALPFPDAISISGGVVDCALLGDYYATPDGAALSEEQRTAINGHLTTDTCGMWDATFAPIVDPSGPCTIPGLSAAGPLIGGLPDGGFPLLPRDEVYDAETNPDGLRCTLQDSNVNLIGTDPETGFARRPWDNVGVEYGLGALRDGVIDLDTFLALNEGIGSYDIDGNHVAERAEADEDTIRTAYATGRVTDGSGDLRRIPIISVNVWTDDQGDIHDRFRAFSMRERLRNPDGSNPPNHMIWTRGLPDGSNLVQSLSGSLDVGSEAITVLDTWLTALDADTSGDPIEVRLERTRPDEAIDNCITADGERLSGLGIYDEPGPCRDLYPLHGDPRTVAGAPLADDVLKCSLQPVAEAVEQGRYGQATEEQVTRLEVIFPDGVCDFSRPGVGQVPVEGVWLRYPR